VGSWVKIFVFYLKRKQFNQKNLRLSTVKKNRKITLEYFTEVCLFILSTFSLKKAKKSKLWDIIMLQPTLQNEKWCIKITEMVDISLPFVSIIIIAMHCS
jgi:hypothetical protein